MRKKPVGMSLVSVLVAMALLSILSLLLVSVFGNMTRLLVRSGLTSDADSLVRYIQLLLSQPNICDNALVDGAGNKLFWPVLTTPVAVDHIQVSNGTGAPPPTIAATTQLPASQIAPDLKLVGIQLRQPDPAAGEGQPNVQSNIQQNGKTYTVTTAKVEFDFDATTSGLLGPRTVDVVVMIQTSPGPLVGQVAYCYQGQKVPSVDSQCVSSTDLYTGSGNNLAGYPAHTADCPAAAVAAASAANPCGALYYIAGFDDSGKAICACHIWCGESSWGGTGPGGLPKPVGSPGSWTKPSAPTAPYNFDVPVKGF